MVILNSQRILRRGPFVYFGFHPSIDKRGSRVNNARKSNRTLLHGQIADYDWAHFVLRYFLMTFALITLRPSALRREVMA